MYEGSKLNYLQVRESGRLAQEFKDQLGVICSGKHPELRELDKLHN